MIPRTICRAALLALLYAATCPSSLAQKPPKESWTGMYFNGKKIGYSNIKTEDSSFHGKSAVKITSDSITRIELLGNKVSQDASFTLFTDSSYTPLYQEFKMSSNGSSMAFKADYLPGKIRCVVNAGGGDTVKEVPVPPGVKLVGDSSLANQGKPVPVGHKETFHYLNPVTLALDRLDIEVLASEMVRLGGTDYKALKIKATTPLGAMTSWETLSGEVLKGELPLGMSIYKESREVAHNMSASMPLFAVAGFAPAVASSYTPPPDFAAATAISVEKPIQKPRETRSLSVVVSGIDDKARVISDSRQLAASVAGQAGAHRLDVVVKQFDPNTSVKLPITSPNMKSYLDRAAYLETDDPQIRDTALEIKGTEKNAYKVASAIRKWVHKTMKPDYTIGVPRSCVNLYRDPKGVCRDYATLFAGLARAAGVPTRLAGGILYAEGKFYYHAWVECWVGEWVAFDPTLTTDYVDATHVKFSQGDVTDMYNVAGIVGRIKLKVLSVQ